MLSFVALQDTFKNQQPLFLSADMHALSANAQEMF